MEYIKIKITSDYEKVTRKRLFASLLQSNWMHLIKQKLGHLETILMIDVPAAAKKVEAWEQVVIKYCKSKNFSLEGLKERIGSAMPVWHPHHE